MLHLKYEYGIHLSDLFSLKIARLKLSVYLNFQTLLKQNISNHFVGSAFLFKLNNCLVFLCEFKVEKII